MSPYFTLDSIPPDEIYVLDTETTGLDGAPKDLVLDIGICRVNLREGTVEDCYSSVLGYDVDEWDECLTGAWIFSNSDLTIDDIAFARKSALQVMDEVRRLLKGKNVTAYNKQFDFGRFLYQEPWNMRGWFNECSDIMKAAAGVCKIPGKYGDYQYPKLEFAYGKIPEGDPAGLGGKQDHRALSDARAASWLMIKMFADGDYRPRRVLSGAIQIILRSIIHTADIRIKNAETER